MPYVTGEGVRIYYEVDGQGPPLVLMHSLTNSLKAWRHFGYAKALKDDFRLILLDSRGHGNSEKPHEFQAYHPELITGDIIAVLNDLGVGTAHYWGYSLGCRIGFQLLKYHAARFSAYILGAASPYPPQEAEKQLSNLNFIFTRLRLGAEQGPEAVIAFWEKTLGRPVSDFDKQRIRGNDYQALLALASNVSQWPSIGDQLSQIAVPCLLYAGERDPFHIVMKEAAKYIPDACFVSLPELTHREAFREAQARNIILPHVKRFLTRVST